MSQRSSGVFAKLTSQPGIITIVFVGLFLTTLLGVGFRAPKAHAINEPIDTNHPKITGLWNTGLDNSVVTRTNPCGAQKTSQLLPLPPRVLKAGGLDCSNSDIPYPPATADYDNPYNVNEVRDPHWRLTGIDNPASGSPHCQDGTARQATTIEPPYWPPAVPGDWVWWRGTINAFALNNSRWIGARPNSYHDTVPGVCLDISTPSDPNSWPTWKYQLVGGFNVGTCVATNSVQFNLSWAADDAFEMLVNEGTPNQRTIIPSSFSGGSPVTTPATSGAFKPGLNTLTVKVRSSFPLTGFAIAWGTPFFDCVQPKPYLKVFGNDIAAGGQFGSCDIATLPNNRAAILTFDQQVLTAGSPPTIENWKGASTQLGAFALGQIEGFYSGGNHSPRQSAKAEGPVNGLTFGNYGDPTIDLAGNWDTSGQILDPKRVVADGGKGGQYRCITDYYDVVSKNIGGAASAANPVTISSTAAGYYKPVSGKLTINGGTISDKHAIVVDGDVYIHDNVNYVPYGSASGIPSVYIIAKGDIYIDSSVTSLSGVYIAQPKADGTKGTIYTCANSTSYIAASQLKATCDQGLIVNGAFIANQVKFLRTNG
ncbi:MAG: hypothetical protein ABIQ89_02395, partial [Candidatus Saccharimonadales bacterium]